MSIEQSAAPPDDAIVRQSTVLSLRGEQATEQSDAVAMLASGRPPLKYIDRRRRVQHRFVSCEATE